ncbi:Rieske (2Fe-2S) protein [Haloglomus halophilum]|uniref:Rieske (2Fe-2S) protein n=1 Tax=Haloglomus halophilum TaxID=2962672 RepID=UPI0020C9DE3C|nr:Rieske 2Fe-2S domain-containing protein [Haloglomus halophilum]
MSPRTHLTSADDVPEQGGWLFTVEEPDGSLREVFLVELDDGIAAWKNYCQHETDQELYREDIGAVMRDGGIVCPKHGSVFDAATGYCDNGKAAGSTLAEVDVTEELGQVYLTDEDVAFSHAGPADAGSEDDDDDDMPGSTSHMTF